MLTYLIILLVSVLLSVLPLVRACDKRQKEVDVIMRRVDRPVAKMTKAVLLSPPILPVLVLSSYLQRDVITVAYLWHMFIAMCCDVIVC